MRGAGCTYNDILDRKLDAGVERTRNRPLPSGRVSVGAAAVFLVAQSLVGLAVLLCFNRFSIWLGIASLADRRRLSPDEAGHLVAAGGARPRLLLGGADGLERDLRQPRAGPGPALRVGLRWTIGYDTIYALQDARDDAIVGIRSTARLFGGSARLGVGLFYAAAGVLALSRSRWPAAAGVALIGWLAYAVISPGSFPGSRAPTRRRR